jgi:hypothetical protein
MNSPENNDQSARKEIEILVNRTKLRHRILREIIEKLTQAEKTRNSQGSGKNETPGKK